MTNDEILNWAKEIRNGSGIDIFEVLKRVRFGSIPFEYRHNSIFRLGLEYGVLFAISKILQFDNKI